VGRLGKVNALLDALDAVIEVAVGDVEIGPAVEVVVEKEAAEAESEKRGTADLGGGRDVDKEAVALVVVEGDHLVGKIGYDEAGVAGAVVVGGIDAHAGRRATPSSL